MEEQEEVVMASKKAARLTHLKAKLTKYEDLQEQQKQKIAKVWSDYVIKSEEESVLQKKVDMFVKDGTEECRRIHEDLKRVAREVLVLGDAKSVASAEGRRLARKIAAKKIKIAVAGGLFAK